MRDEGSGAKDLSSRPRWLQQRQRKQQPAKTKNENRKEKMEKGQAVWLAPES
jgi:hypothetical protein